MVGPICAGPRGCSDNVDETARRLGEKILDAFNHAYATGETEIAARLRAVIAAGEAEGMLRISTVAAELLERAERWAAFVDARNAYRLTRRAPTPDPGAVTAALERMKDAYCRWCLG